MLGKQDMEEQICFNFDCLGFGREVLTQGTGAW